MAKYIDADELKNTLVSSGAIGDFGQYLIDIQPAADVRPERHGEWIFQKADDDYSWKPWLCSNCNTAGGKNQTMFCPNCGAKMDGKEESG